MEHHHYQPEMNHIGAIPDGVPPRVQLRAWMVEQQLDTLSMEDLEAFPLWPFLDETLTIQLSADERLRELAIFFEPSAAASSQPRGWRMLQRIYEQATQIAPQNHWIGHSQARSALLCVDRRLSTAVRQQIFAEARHAVEQALFTHPHQPLLLSVMGELLYRQGDPEAALSWLERALHRAPELPWAALYRAHVLRALHRWDEAAQAYDRVPVDVFTGPAAWRTTLLLEQRGWCKLKAGNGPDALADFLTALDRYEADLDLAERVMSRTIVTVAQRAYPEVLQSRVLAIARKIRWAWARDMLEPIENAP